ncbi:TauD/TfdA family dioxygenase [Thiothrix fructosivorans]|uniref:TauD/TfdA family dioxygenase n=1 Tax=Thiothrix fructosivorans TaxID=111770 RepID=A0A8B0SQT3_9GAMM|nr:TauD/TfdA family dioxygenase [Thiothrix fructosivorans]MBO0611450.1 TauD/TfdA family dioxygenase [Thiothrix fructosivorans]QTX12990.1 TauD/TfdA family dioxygenase [Thiothrix fructosivorans]
MYSPFLPDNDALYQRWREQKLQHYPVYLEDLIVEVRDPRNLSDAEHQAMLTRCRKANMVIYAGKTGDDPDRSIPHRMAQQFGLQHLDHNWLADDDGLTSLTVAAADSGEREHYIPYSNRLIQWHTDGYYNLPEQQIHGLLLHCVRSAPEGGENRLLDHEIAYLRLRDQNPDYIRALMQSDVMTIPARTDGDTVARAENVGPVFAVDPLTGDLHMRYTIRGRNVVWKDDSLTRQALAALSDWLECGSSYIFRGKLEPGMGLVSNNVLHDRSGFTDTENHRRLLYRARYMDRIAGTSIREWLA